MHDYNKTFKETWYGVHKFYVIHKTVTYTFTTSLQHYIIPYMPKLSSGKVSRNTIHRKKLQYRAC